MNNFFYWFFAGSCIVFFLRHISLKYFVEVEYGEEIKEWTKIIGIVFVFFIGFRTTETYEFLLRFFLLEQRFGIPDTNLAQALTLVIFLTVILSILVTIFIFFESLIKDEFSEETFLNSIVTGLEKILFFFTGHLFYIPLVYIIYVFFAIFFAGINSGELTGREINMVFSWLAVSFFTSIFYNMIVDGYRKNRYGNEEMRKEYKKEREILKKKIKDKKRYLEITKGVNQASFVASSSELDIFKEELRKLRRNPKSYFEEKGRLEELKEV